MAATSTWAATSKGLLTVPSHTGMVSLLPSLCTVSDAAESAALAGPHGRAAASHWGLSGSAARPERIAQPGAWRVSPRRASAVSCGGTRTALSTLHTQAAQHGGQVAMRVDRLLVAPALQLVRIINVPPVVEASLLLVLQRRRGAAARLTQTPLLCRTGGEGGEGYGRHTAEAQNGAPRSRAGCRCRCACTPRPRSPRPPRSGRLAAQV